MKRNVCPPSIPGMQNEFASGFLGIFTANLIRQHITLRSLLISPVKAIASQTLSRTAYMRMIDSSPQCCPLCGSSHVDVFHRDEHRDYQRCERCLLVFVPSTYFLSLQEEKACYDHHQNCPENVDYRIFLGRLFHPLKEKLASGATGLDFGSGPGPTLSVMLQEAGFSTAIYDPFYAPDESVLDNEYDFITTSEVIEHLHRPRIDLQRIWSILKPGGWLAVMTKRVRDAQAFSTWHYKNDPTHVIFFSKATFAWLAEQWSATLEVIGPDVVLLQKPTQSTTPK